MYAASSMFVASSMYKTSSCTLLLAITKRSHMHARTAQAARALLLLFEGVADAPAAEPRLPALLVTASDAACAAVVAALLLPALASDAPPTKGNLQGNLGCASFSLQCGCFVGYDHAPDEATTGKQTRNPSAWVNMLDLPHYWQNTTTVLGVGFILQ